MIKDHQFFDPKLAAGDAELPLDERIVAAVAAMRRRLGLSAQGPGFEARVRRELRPGSMNWVFNDLEKNGIRVDGKDLLDCGAGFGGASLEAIARGANPVAVEPGRGLREILEQRISRAGRGRVVDASGEHLPFPDHSFDLAVSVQVLEHVENPQPYLDEVFRVLKPGCYLWLSCANYLCFREQHYQVAWFPLLPKPIGALYLRLRGRPTEFLWRSITYTTPFWVVRMLRRSGFDLLKELRLRERASPNLKFRVAKSVLGVEGACRLSTRQTLIRQAFRPGFKVIARKPT